MTAPEFSRRYPLDAIGDGGRQIAIEADAEERARLAERFGLLSLDALSAEARLSMRSGIVHAEGRIRAHAVQPCVVTGEPVLAAIDEPFTLRFTDSMVDGDEIELSDEDCDTLPLDGGAVDLGEAVAETLSLALPAFPRAAGARDALRAAGVLSEEEAVAARNPFAALKDRLG